LEGAPVCRLAPTPQNFLWHTWWHFSTEFFAQFLAVWDSPLQTFCDTNSVTAARRTRFLLLSDGDDEEWLRAGRMTHNVILSAAKNL